MTRFIIAAIAVFVAPAASALAQTVFEVQPGNVVTFGTDGDAFSVEKLLPDEAIILLKPKGEDCTLRFPLPTGNTLYLRVEDAKQRPLLCNAELMVVRGTKARFSAECWPRSASMERKCPP